MKNFEYYLNKINEQDTFNTEKETKLKAYQKNVEYYNANKNKFINIFSKDENQWEKDAEKIIDGNTYLNSLWVIEKIKNNITKLENKLREAELSSEEKQSIEEQIQENTGKIKEQQKELDNKIRLDLNDINSL